jgi:hypothetical protein
MKKLFVAATLGLALVSCGGPTVCECVEMAVSGKLDDATDKKCEELEKGMDPKQFIEELGKCK